MRSHLAMVLLLTTIGSLSACRTTQKPSDAASKASVRAPATKPKPVTVVAAKPEVIPASKSAPNLATVVAKANPVSANLDLVNPGPQEYMGPRNAKSRCPQKAEIDKLEQLMISLGPDTMDLVREDLSMLRDTAMGTDARTIDSCCNQLEQLLQDVEIINDDIAEAIPVLEQVKSQTLSLCPAFE